MKVLFYLAVLMAVFSCKENSTSGKEPTEDRTTKVVDSTDIPLQAVEDLISVEDIKKEYAYITQLIENGRMDSTSFGYNCRNEKNGKLSYFSEKGQLRKIKHTYNEYSHFSATDEYYIKDGELFFVFQNQVTWSFTGENQTQDNITEKRFYIIDNSPIQCLEKKYTILSDAKNDPQAPVGTNKDVECGSLQPISKDFELFLKLRNQKEDLGCLEGSSTSTSWKK